VIEPVTLTRTCTRTDTLSVVVRDGVLHACAFVRVCVCEFVCVCVCIQSNRAESSVAAKSSFKMQFKMPEFKIPQFSAPKFGGAGAATSVKTVAISGEHIRHNFSVCVSRACSLSNTRTLTQPRARARTQHMHVHTLKSTRTHAI